MQIRRAVLRARLTWDDPTVTSSFRIVKLAHRVR